MGDFECALCGAQLPDRPSWHDCVGIRIAAAVTAERKRTAKIIREYFERQDRVSQTAEVTYSQMEELADLLEAGE